MSIGSAPAQGAAPAKAAAAEKKEEKKEEEADVDMGGLFGDDYWGAHCMEHYGLREAEEVTKKTTKDGARISCALWSL